MKTYIVKLFDSQNVNIWNYKLYGYSRTQALNIFCQIIVSDKDIQFDINNTARIEIEQVVNL